MNNTPIAVGCDHGGLELKVEIVRFLKNRGIEIKDYGVFSPDSVDYPDIGKEVARAVSKKEYDRGILVCGAGIGMSIVANKYPGVRAALCHDDYTAKMSREHNDANILVMGGRILEVEKAIEAVNIWLDTEFTGGRHKKRIEKITAIEQELTE